MALIAICPRHMQYQPNDRNHAYEHLNVAAALSTARACGGLTGSTATALLLRSLEMSFAAFVPASSKY